MNISVFCASSQPRNNKQHTMKKILLLCAALLALVASVEAQNTAYKISDFLYTKTIKNSDFIEDRITNIDKYLSTNDVPIDSVFATINGKYDIVYFERYFYGESVLGHNDFFHEAIISKVDDGHIIESYFVSYDWKEPPISYPMQISRKKLPIKHVIPVKELELKLIDAHGTNLIEEDCQIIIPDSDNSIK